jgi:hypothetical protein
VNTIGVTLSGQRTKAELARDTKKSSCRNELVISLGRDGKLESQVGKMILKMEIELNLKDKGYGQSISASQLHQAHRLKNAEFTGFF